MVALCTSLVVVLILFLYYLSYEAKLKKQHMKLVEFHLHQSFIDRILKLCLEDEEIDQIAASIIGQVKQYFNFEAVILLKNYPSCEEQSNPDIFNQVEDFALQNKEELLFQFEADPYNVIQKTVITPEETYSLYFYKIPLFYESLIICISSEDNRLSQEEVRFLTTVVNLMQLNMSSSICAPPATYTS